MNIFAQSHLSFSQLGNSAISVKGKGLTNVKMYAERKVSKGKLEITRPPSNKCQ